MCGRGLVIWPLDIKEKKCWPSSLSKLPIPDLQHMCLLFVSFFFFFFVCFFSLFFFSCICLYICHCQCCQFSNFVARFIDFPTPFETFFKSLGTNMATSWTNLIQVLILPTDLYSSLYRSVNFPLSSSDI